MKCLCTSDESKDSLSLEDVVKPEQKNCPFFKMRVLMIHHYQFMLVGLPSCMPLVICHECCYSTAEDKAYELHPHFGTSLFSAQLLFVQLFSFVKSVPV